jgi:hypothetical protein
VLILAEHFVPFELVEHYCGIAVDRPEQPLFEMVVADAERVCDQTVKVVFEARIFWPTSPTEDCAVVHLEHMNLADGIGPSFQEELRHVVVLHDRWPSVPAIASVRKTTGESLRVAYNLNHSASTLNAADPDQTTQESSLNGRFQTSRRLLRATDFGAKPTFAVAVRYALDAKMWRLSTSDQIGYGLGIPLKYLGSFRR